MQQQERPQAFTRMSAADFNAHVTGVGASAKGAHSRSPRVARSDPEEDLQRACFEWVQLHEARYPVLRFVFHSPNGGKRTKAQAGRFKSMGVRKGVLDFICQFPAPGGSGLAIELKAGKGRLTEDQREYLDAAEQHGCVTGVCFTLDQFITLVRRYLGVSC